MHSPVRDTSLSSIYYRWDSCSNLFWLTIGSNHEENALSRAIAWDPWNSYADADLAVIKKKVPNQTSDTWHVWLSRVEIILLASFNHLLGVIIRRLDMKISWDSYCTNADRNIKKKCTNAWAQLSWTTQAMETDTQRRFYWSHSNFQLIPIYSSCRWGLLFSANVAVTANTRLYPFPTSSTWLTSCIHLSRTHSFRNLARASLKMKKTFLFFKVQWSTLFASLRMPKRAAYSHETNIEKLLRNLINYFRHMLFLNVVSS